MTAERSLPGVPSPLRDPRPTEDGALGQRWRSTAASPIQFVKTPRRQGGSEVLPPIAEQWRKLLMLDVIHDGDFIPEEFLRREDGSEIPATMFQHAYEQERDWGASDVAAALARELGLDGFWRVEVARVVMDFGRFPGITPKDASHLDRRAIN